MMDWIREGAITDVAGTFNLVEEGLDAGATQIVAISTEKAIFQSCIMAKSKRVSSVTVRELRHRSGRCCVAVRFGIVLGMRGSIVREFKGEDRARGIYRYRAPGYHADLHDHRGGCDLMLQPRGIGNVGELLELKTGEHIQIVDLAIDFIGLSLLTEDQIRIGVTGLRQSERLHESPRASGAVVETTAH